ncbi:MAG: hypothetical protein ACTSPB_02325 [Candidatus Thorarchaeota archaeon]
MHFSVDKDEFSTLMSIASELDEFAPIRIDESSLNVLMMSRDHVVLLNASFTIDDLEDYEPTEVVLNSNLILKKLKLTQKGKINCEIKDNLFIMRQKSVIAKMNVDQKHEIFLMSKEGLDPVDTSLLESVLEKMRVFVKMPNAKTFKDILSNIGTDSFTIEATENQLIVKSGGMGEGFDSEVAIDVPVIIKGDDQLSSNYTTDLVKPIVNKFPSDSNLSIKFAVEAPLIVSLMDERNTMDVLIAPVIS